MASASLSQSYCPSGVFTGIVTLSGQISPSSLSSIATKEPPLTIAFSPRQTLPTLVGNQIEDSFENTVLYKGTRYGMASTVQICVPLHTGYPIPNTSSPVAEMIISFSNNTTSGSYPSGILLCIPIYESSVESHSAYIQQLIMDNPIVASIQTVFFEGTTDKSQTSLGYQTCIEAVTENLEAESGIQTFNLFVLVFTNGITINSTNFQLLLSKISGKNKLIPSFMLPPALRGGFPTVSSYKYDSDGNKINPVLSSSGMLYTTQVSTGSNDFSDRFEAFPALKLSANGKTVFNNSCPYYKSTQYKCVPFDRLKNMKGEYVIPEGATLSTILTSQTDNINNASLAGESSGINTRVLETVAVVAGSTVAAIVLAFLIGHYVVKLSED